MEENETLKIWIFQLRSIINGTISNFTEKFNAPCLKWNTMLFGWRRMFK